MYYLKYAPINFFQLREEYLGRKNIWIILRSSVANLGNNFKTLNCEILCLKKEHYFQCIDYRLNNEIVRTDIDLNTLL